MKITIFYVLLLLSLVTAQTGLDDSLYCQTETYISSTTGTLSDHVNGTNMFYRLNTNCNWYISPPQIYSTAVFIIESIDTEYTYDALSIFNTDGTLVATFTGSQAPLQPVIFQSTNASNTIQVQFQSDTSNNGRGFVLSYYLDVCQPSCGSNGKCNSTGSCECFPGWTGSGCLTATCANTNNCSGNGLCVQQSCSCNPGWSGVDCSTPFSSGNYSLTSPSGRVRSQAFGTAPLVNHTLTITASAPAASSSVIVFTFQTVDLAPTSHLYLYDGQQSFDLAGANAKNLIYSFYSGQAVVNYVAPNDVYTGYAGYILNFNTTVCNGCSSTTGFCTPSGECKCLPGYNGTNCAQSVAYNNCWGHGSVTADGTCSCQGGWSGLDCSVCTNATCAPTTCGGIQTSPLGLFTSTQTNTTSCNWNLKTNTPGSVMVLTENSNVQNSDQLTFSDLRLNVRDFSGFSKLTPQLITTTSSVNFTSSNSSSFYNGQYYSVNCFESCNLNGACFPTNEEYGTCFCNNNYQGDTCQQGICHDGCSGDGNCNNGQCVCNTNWGADCSQTYCTGLKSINLVEDHPVIITDHTYGTSSANFTTCSWRIYNDAANPLNAHSAISIVFTRTQMGIFSSLGASPTTLYSTVESTLGGFASVPLPPRNLELDNSRSATLTFSIGSNNFQPTSGFEAEATLLTDCPASCSQNGVCFQGRCLCFPGHRNSDCSGIIDPDNLTPVYTFNSTIVGTVPDYQWNYYVVNLPYALNGLAFFFGQTTAYGAPFWTIVPDHMGLPNFTSPMYSSDMAAGFRYDAGNYYIGVYSSGVNNVGSVNFSLAIIGGCPDDCGNGVCDGLGNCDCNECYTGVFCQYQICDPNADYDAYSYRQRLGAAVAILFIIIVLLFVCVVVVIVVQRARANRLAQQNNVPMTEMASEQPQEVVSLDVLPPERGLEDRV